MSNCKIPKDVEAYLDFIEKNPQKHNKNIKKLAILVRKAFKNEQLNWSEEQIETYFSYQKYFPFALFPWEKFAFVLHNCVFREDGNPRWPDLFLLVGRGNGKNGYLSFEDFCLTSSANGIPNYNIDIVATSEKQAKVTPKDIREVLSNDKWKHTLPKIFKWTKEVITCIKTNSEINYHTNNPKSKDGLRPGKVDFDEVHAYSNWKNIEVFTGALGKTADARITYASTQGEVRDGPLDELIEDSELILNGEIDDDGLLPLLFALDDPKEVHDPEKWILANPSLPYLPNLLEVIKKQYNKYKRRPTTNASFMIKRMNCPATKAEDEVTSYENVLATKRDIPDLTGCSGIVGIDYTKTNDMASCGILIEKDKIYYWIQKSWFCNQSVDKERIKAPLKEWSLMKVYEIHILEFVNDVEISPELIIDFILMLGREFVIEGIVLDNFRYSIMKKALESIGYDALDKEKVKLVRPSDIMKVQPIIESAFNRHGIIFGDSPIMRWFVGNTKLVPKERDNFEYGKIEKRSRKNDGFMAFVAAMTWAEKLAKKNVDFDDFKVYTF